MQDLLVIMGLVLQVVPIGDYDRRIVILTKERGKIAAFAKGARKQNSRLLAATNPFSFGEFKLYVGKSSYNLVEASISNCFQELREDLQGAYYGMYFLEIMDYYTRENNDEREMLKLLYQSLKALSKESIPNELVRYIFEIKAIVLNGEFPGIPTEESVLQATKYTVDYIARTGIESLYTFTVTNEVLNQLGRLAKKYQKNVIDKKIKSLEILEALLQL